jgi:hypothetical protein
MRVLGGNLRRYGATLSCALTLFALPLVEADKGSDIWFSGRVLSLDQHRGVVRIARGPTETAGPAVEDCAIAQGALRSLRPGMVIEAQADTRRRPWRILHLRIFHRRVDAPAS